MTAELYSVLPAVGIYVAGVLSTLVVKSFAAGRSVITREEVLALLHGYMPRETLKPELDAFRRDVMRLEETIGRLEQRLDREADRRRDHTGGVV